MTDRYPFDPLDFERLSAGDARKRLEAFSATVRTRRTVREYSADPIPQGLVEECIRVAGSAPSGANQQPWHFVVVTDPEMKKKIRIAAEEEEHENYHGRMPPEWLAKLAPLGTDEHKPFLETAPCLIVVFRVDYGLLRDDAGNEVKEKHYYVGESVGLAAGYLLAALQMAGLATLTHTPSPMGFLSRVLGMPRNMKPFLLIPVGYPADDAKVPRITKKSLDEIITRV